MIADTDQTPIGFVFRPLDGWGHVTPAQRYRKLLKIALRALGLRCVGLVPMQDDGHPLPPVPDVLNPEKTEPPF